MRGRGAWVGGVVVVLVALLVGSIDRSRTENKVPPFPPPGQSSLPRYERIRQLDHDFDRRALMYGGVAAVALGLAAAAALAGASTQEQQRRVFGQVGVAGVVLGLLGALLLWTTRGNIEPPWGAVFAPAGLLLAIAALGGSVARLQRPPPEETPMEGRPLRRVALAALSFTAVTVVLAYVYAAQQDGSCDVHMPAPAWAGVVGWAAGISAAAAFLLGLAGLAARRWFVALVCVVVNPAALVYMLLSTGIAC